MRFQEIDTTTNEGKYLLAALAILTTQPKLILFGHDDSGTDKTPDEMMEYIGKLKEQMYLTQ